MKILFFAAIRERVGQSEMTMDLPSSVKTVSDLVVHLSAGDEAIAEAMAERFFVRMAVNETHADWETEIKDTDEIAFFPPITGG